MELERFSEFAELNAVDRPLEVLVSEQVHDDISGCCGGDGPIGPVASSSGEEGEDAAISQGMFEGDGFSGFEFHDGADTVAAFCIACVPVGFDAEAAGDANGLGEWAVGGIVNGEDGVCFEDGCDEWE